MTRGVARPRDPRAVRRRGAGPPARARSPSPASAWSDDDHARIRAHRRARCATSYEAQGAHRPPGLLAARSGADPRPGRPLPDRRRRPAGDADGTRPIAAELRASASATTPRPGRGSPLADGRIAAVPGLGRPHRRAPGRRHPWCSTTRPAASDDYTPPQRRQPRRARHQAPARVYASRRPGQGAGTRRPRAAPSTGSCPSAWASPRIGYDGRRRRCSTGSRARWRTIVDGIERGAFPAQPDDLVQALGHRAPTATPTASASPTCGVTGSASATHPAIAAYAALAEPGDAGVTSHRHPRPTPWPTTQPSPTRRRATASRPPSTTRCSWRRAPGRARPGPSSSASSSLVTTGTAGLDAHRRHHVHREGRGRAARPRAGASSKARSNGRRQRWPTGHGGRPRVPRCPRRPRRRRHRHAPQLRPAAAGRAPHRGGAAPAARGSRRGGVGGRLRRPVGRFVDRLLADPAVEQSLLLATAAGVRLDHLRLIALAFNENWDLADRPGPSSAVEVEPWDESLMALLDEADELGAAPRPLLRRRRSPARPPRRPGRSGPAACRRPATSTRGSPCSGQVAAAPRAGRNGRRENWPGVRPRRAPRPVRRRRPAVDALRQRVLEQAVRAAGRRPAPLHARAGRRAPGGGRARVPRPAGPRPPDAARPAPTGARSAPPSTSATATSSSTSSRTPTPSRSSWRSSSPGHRPTRRHRRARRRGTPVETRPGHLFFVGDPKQSIYRFRRADISLFLRAARRFGADEHGVALTTNFRTGAGRRRRRQRRVRAVDRREARRRHAVPAALCPVRTGASRCPRRPAGHGARGRGPRRQALRGRPPPARGGRRRRDRAARGGRGLARRPCPARSSTRLATGPARRRRRSSSPHAPRSPPSKTPCPEPASPTGPSPRRSSTPAAWSATCSSPCGPSTTRPTSWLSSPPSARRCSAVATTTSIASGASTTGTSTTAGRCPEGSTPPTRSSPASRTCASSTTSAAGCPPASSPIASCAIAGSSSWARPTGGPATCGGECGSSSIRRGPGPMPPTARCASTWRGSGSRPPRAAGWPRRCCPRPTTTPSAS